MFKTLYSFLFSGKHKPCSRWYCVPRSKIYTSFNTNQHKEKKKNRQKNWWPGYIIERSIFVFVVPTVNIKTGYIVLGAIIMQL